MVRRRSGGELGLPRHLLLAQELQVRIIDAATSELARQLTRDPACNYHPAGRPPAPMPRTPSTAFVMSQEIENPEPTSGSGCIRRRCQRPVPAGGQRPRHPVHSSPAPPRLPAQRHHPRARPASAIPSSPAGPDRCSCSPPSAREAPAHCWFNPDTGSVRSNSGAGRRPSARLRSRRGKGQTDEDHLAWIGDLAQQGSPAGLKDLVLLGAALWTLGDSLGAARSWHAWPARSA
jgi:hypothetical protein